jgi:hypothetical protein
MAADLTKSNHHLQYDFFRTAPGIKDIIKASGATSANPADFTAVTNASALTTAAVTVSGVAVGDVVLGWGVVSGLAANQFVVAAFVSGTDTVTLIIGNALNTTVTTTAVVVNLIIADVT